MIRFDRFNEDEIEILGSNKTDPEEDNTSNNDSRIVSMSNDLFGSADDYRPEDDLSEYSLVRSTQNVKKTRTYWLYALIGLLALAIITIAIVALRGARKPDMVQTAKMVESPTEITAQEPIHQAGCYSDVSESIVEGNEANNYSNLIEKITRVPHEFADTINDVPFTVVNLDGYRAEVTFELPDSIDPNVVLVTTAADYRADNGEIVCEFIHDGKMMSRGIRKPGFCYVGRDGVVTIGNGEGNDYKRLALSDGGTFFRQYALVMDGEIQPNVLKGKSKRRALAFLNGKPVLVMSHSRESIYDFSQALADYGFSHAIYLPGGDGILRAETDQGSTLQKYRPKDQKYANYLVFRRQMPDSTPRKMPRR